MSHLNYLEKLLDGVDVEWLPMKSLCSTITTGKLNANAMEDDGIYPFYTCNENPYKINSYAFDLEAIIISGNGSQVGHLNYYKGRFNAYQRTYVVGGFEEKIIVMYLFHYLNYTLKSYITQNSRKGSVPYITMPMLENFQVPIPCPDNPEKSLAIQAEIVRILDAFTAMTAELTAELNLRKKQYNYYRDQLLSFEEGDFEWMTLGDVTKKWYSGGTPTAGKPEFYEGGNIPWLRTQEVKFSDVSETEVFITPAALKNSSAKWIPENCVIIAISGATAGRSAINKIPLTTNQHCGCLEIDDKKALYRYVFHWVSFNYENIKALGQGSRGDLNSTIIKNFRLPVPYANDPEKSLAEQARIVAILDKFDTLTTSLQEGLPREIELRQKQYEYYRDLLLSFPKQNAEVSA
ncbi:restriction endonuclease subunit S [Vibrio fluvialis]|uniref:restriction endonuclease subunit S n=1 Tax=Vibrio fluvialis TaxID=676 RepID=UPI001C9C1FDC|nr:restriction endonuclease subunit S [Vibrio fluvialis]MBY8088924.1 restriction endonuclease subunit S [Vibrio fluvialis]MCE7594754.1 restriction endonuclease subunit S [Vibrio fluvialis]